MTDAADLAVTLGCHPSWVPRLLAVVERDHPGLLERALLTAVQENASAGAHTDDSAWSLPTDEFARSNYLGRCSDTRLAAMCDMQLDQDDLDAVLSEIDARRHDREDPSSGLPQ